MFSSNLLGMDEKRLQYELGAGFCAEVEERWGADALPRIWDGPDNLPTKSELSDPTGWAARVLLEDPFAGLSRRSSDRLIDRRAAAARVDVSSQSYRRRFMALHIGIICARFHPVEHEKGTSHTRLAQGQKGMIVFIPFPFTGVCTGEVCQLRDNTSQLNDLEHERSGDHLRHRCEQREVGGDRRTRISDTQ